MEAIERKLTEDLKHVFECLGENELLVNLNKGKMEVILFRTAKKISQQSCQKQVIFCGTSLNNTEIYTYLGHTLNRSLSMRANFDGAN